MDIIQIRGRINQEILEGCMAGRRDCQEALYNHFAPVMFGLCLRYSKDYHAAEDLLQEGFIKVFNKLDRYRGDGSFEGWLKRIFINTAIEYYRKAKQFIPVDIEEAKMEIHDDKAIDKLAHNELLKLIQKLPTGYRTVFNLYAIEGYTHREVASMLGISEGTSKSQLARARTILQRSVKALETI